jgi:hypothetical protein
MDRNATAKTIADMQEGTPESEVELIRLESAFFKARMPLLCSVNWSELNSKYDIDRLAAHLVCSAGVSNHRTAWRSNCLAVALCLAYEVPEIDSATVFSVGNLAQLDAKLGEKYPYSLLVNFTDYFVEHKTNLGASFEHLARFTITAAGRELVREYMRSDSN